MIIYYATSVIYNWNQNKKYMKQSNNYNSRKKYLQLSAITDIA